MRHRFGTCSITVLRRAAGAVLAALCLSACAGTGPTAERGQPPAAADSAALPSPSAFLQNLTMQRIFAAGAVDNYTVETEAYTAYHRQMYFPTALPLFNTQVEQGAMAGTQLTNRLIHLAASEPFIEALTPFYLQLRGQLPGYRTTLSEGDAGGHYAYVLHLRPDSSAAVANVGVAPSAQDQPAERRIWIDPQLGMPRRMEITELTTLPSGRSVPVRTTVEWMLYEPVPSPPDTLQVPRRVAVYVEGIGQTLSEREQAAVERRIQALRQRLDALPPSKREGAAMVLQPRLEAMQMLLSTEASRQVFDAESVRVNEGVPDEYFPENPRINSLPGAAPDSMPDSMGFRVLRETVRRHRARVAGTAGYTSRTEQFTARHPLYVRHGLRHYALDLTETADDVPGPVMVEAAKDWSDLVYLYQFEAENVRYQERDTLRGRPVDVIRFPEIVPHGRPDAEPSMQNFRFWVDAESRLVHRTSAERTFSLGGPTAPFWARVDVDIESFQEAAPGLPVSENVSVTLHPVGRLATAEGRTEAREALQKQDEWLAGIEDEDERARQLERFADIRAIIEHLLEEERPAWTFEIVAVEVEPRAPAGSSSYGAGR